ncbi:hypothetical protein DRP05_03140 [Archaeoglobales archaeon]|nr:MAG: hypothetical protein DRP05_03140 [Archaeoglobales archaeon]
MDSKNLKLRLPLLIVVLLTLNLTTANAQVAVTNVEINPQTLLVGDIADCKLTIYNPNLQSVKVSSVQFDVPSGLSVKPNFVNVGYIAKQSSYDLYFYIEAKKSGLYSIEVEIYAENGSTTQRINVVVEDRLPKLTITSPIKLNEVNSAEIEITTPLEITHVTIEPLFEADQKYLFFDEVEYSAKGTIKFYGKKEDYKFRISFYNGKNYHSFIQEIQPKFVESKSLFTNITIPYATTYLYDVIPISVEVSNLRNDTVYQISISTNSAKGKFSDCTKEISKLEPSEAKTVVFYYSPTASGFDDLSFNITYRDEMNNVYTFTDKRSIEVLNQSSVSISNVEVKTQNGITISGDVSNNGRSEVLNVYAVAFLDGNTNDYFVGNIDPSDFQSFNIPISGNGSKALVKITWTNKIGETFEITKEVKVKQNVVIKAETTPAILVVAVIVVVVFVAVAIYNYRKRRT